MKVLSIKQPWASLVVNGYKQYEFRTFSTKYRGELYIQSSVSYNKKDIKKFDKYNLDYPTGQIIGKVNLIDCIKIDEDFKKELQKIDDIIYANLKDYEGYAWKLEDSKVIKPIPVKGKLGIWNYYNENDILKLMSDLDYGWVDKRNNRYLNPDETFPTSYFLQSPEKTIKNKIGTCYDQVELERYYFASSNYNIKTYCLIYYDKNQLHTHTFLIFKKDACYYWLENAWRKYNGIHKYYDEQSLLADIKNKFILSELNTKFNHNNLVLYEYQKPEYNMSYPDLLKFFENSNKIDISNI